MEGRSKPFRRQFGTTKGPRRARSGHSISTHYAIASKLNDVL